MIQQFFFKHNLHLGINRIVKKLIEIVSNLNLKFKPLVGNLKFPVYWMKKVIFLLLEERRGVWENAVECRCFWVKRCLQAGVAWTQCVIVCSLFSYEWALGKTRYCLLRLQCGTLSLFIYLFCSLETSSFGLKWKKNKTFWF